MVILLMITTITKAMTIDHHDDDNDSHNNGDCYGDDYGS